MNKRIQCALIGFGALVSTLAMAESYPFTLPGTVEASININTSRQEPFNNLLLGTNIFGYTSKTEQALINKFDPITVRFPHGLWANWYDWRTDQTRVFGTDTFQYQHANGTTRTQALDHLAQIKIMDQSKIKVGIDGLEQLFHDKKRENNKGYDMLWTFNMSADGRNFNNGSPETMARYNDLIARGFPVKAIELGNENFYPGQRSSIIPNTADYIKRAKSMSRALKAKDPEIKVSVPLLRRDSSPNPRWNNDLTADQSYFDAVTVHTYVGSNPDDPNSGDGAYATALTARHHLATSINDYAAKVAPNKPVWLTEWGVKSGGPNAVSVLGMADSYIFMSQNQDVYERANWFSVNGKLNSFLVWEEYRAANGAMRPRIKYPLEKTAIGSSYEVIRSVFEDSTLLGSWMSSPDLMNGVDAVSARAVVRNGKTTIFVVNLTNKAVPFTVKLDGREYSGAFRHRALAFNSMAAEKSWPVDSDPLTTIKDGTGAITLPKYSMSTIVLKNTNVPSKEFSIGMTAPEDNSKYKVGQSITLKANAVSSENDIQQVNFLVNGAFYKRVDLAPYAVDWAPAAAGTYSVHAIAIKADGTRLPATSRTVIVTSSQPAQGTQCLSYAGSAKMELNLSQTKCVTLPVNLSGKTLSVWDSEARGGCDFRGSVRSVDGKGSLQVNGNFATTSTMTGRKLEFAGQCNYVQIRVY